MEVIGLPNGTCEKPNHGAKLSVNGEPRCIKCVAEAERARRTSIPVVTVEDPGKDAFGSNGMLRPGHKEVSTPVITDIPIGTAQVHRIPAAGIPPISRQLGAIRDAIYGLPMPKSLTQYKRFQKIQVLIDQALEVENATD